MSAFAKERTMRTQMTVMSEKRALTSNFANFTGHASRYRSNMDLNDSKEPLLRLSPTD